MEPCVCGNDQAFIFRMNQGKIVCYQCHRNVSLKETGKYRGEDTLIEAMIKNWNENMSIEKDETILRQDIRFLTANLGKIIMKLELGDLRTIYEKLHDILKAF